MKRQYMQCMSKRRQVKVIQGKVEEKREGTMSVITYELLWLSTQKRSVPSVW